MSVLLKSPPAFLKINTQQLFLGQTIVPLLRSLSHCIHKMIVISCQSNCLASYECHQQLACWIHHGNVPLLQRHDNQAHISFHLSSLSHTMNACTSRCFLRLLSGTLTNTVKTRNFYERLLRVYFLKTIFISSS